MKFIFIDEVERFDKMPDYFGLGAAIFDSYHYPTYKESFIAEFEKLKWDPSVEFKGKYLFSTAGDKNVSIENRINFVKAIAKETNAKSNSRLNFLFASNRLGNYENNYLKLLRKIIDKIKPGGGGQKGLMAYFVDSNEKYKKERIIKCIDDYCKGMVFERPLFIDSDNKMSGIITIDILCYLKSWIETNPQPDEQLKLFLEPNDRKIPVIQEILSNIKIIEDVKNNK